MTPVNPGMVIFLLVLMILGAAAAFLSTAAALGWFLWAVGVLP